jgi:hypothetical protein
MAELDPERSVSIDTGVTLDSNGLSGDAEPFVRRQLGAPSLSNDFLAALNRAGIRAQSIVQIKNAQTMIDPPHLDWKTRSSEAAMELTVTAPGPGRGQFVLQTDEWGVSTVHFAKPAATAANGTRRYLLVRNTATPTRRLPPGVQPAVAGVPGTKTIQVLSFSWNPLGDIAHQVVSAWESKNRRYRVRSFTRQNYQVDEVPDFTHSDWAAVAAQPGKRSLLIIHGTFSRSNTDFGRFPPEYVALLNAKYDGRVFAFDHPTLTDDPRQNAQWFLNAMPDSAELDIDIICHSRGGLVSRVLAEKLDELSVGSRKVNVGSLVFIATPNRGTILTNANHLADYIGSYINLLNFGPVNGAKEILEVVVEIAKLVAVGVAPGLIGLESMLPGGPFLTWLNSGATGDATYYALASDFEPIANPGASDWSEERIDAIFGTDKNDSIVPTDGVWDPIKPGSFPILETTRRLILPEDLGVDHGGFFQNQESREQIATWLSLAP